MDEKFSIVFKEIFKTVFLSKGTFSFNFEGIIIKVEANFNRYNFSFFRGSDIKNAKLIYSEFDKDSFMTEEEMADIVISEIEFSL